jgi:hypothetical protein
METVLPPNEMKALDVLRQQVQYITNPFRTVSGESITSQNIGILRAIEQELDGSLVGILGKIARGGNLEKHIQNKQSRFTDFVQWIYYGQPELRNRPNSRVLNAAKSFAEEWLGLTGKRMGQRASELLVDAMLNPSTIGVEVLQNNPASPRAKSFIRAYVMQKDQMIEQPTVLPFNSLNTKDVQLANGKLLKDGVTGYMIQNSKNKFRTFNDKGLQIGIFDNLEDARQMAVKDYNKSITKKKTGR